ncbi:hypothetical protein [Mycobacterium sp. AZCC_0083]|uniref:hypothetical protein n=1 Tax=Mycobacterium sp. AZCC_0083 TaxID=2735882 RepID=UPI0016179425|nr:hypothetical protein [Mycobacterium sp. AZCC_0083]MBB5167127.1 hypothetical protein [Mycobacterium sp. AZCC_0083]
MIDEKQWWDDPMFSNEKLWDRPTTTAARWPEGTYFTGRIFPLSDLKAHLPDGTVIAA